MSNLRITKTLSDFLVGVKYEDLPSGAITIAKKAIIDGVACAIAGSKEESSAVVTEYVKNYQLESSSTVFTKNLNAPPFFAALVNGTMMHSLDFDDENWTAIIHPTTVMLPAIIAAGEEAEVSGKDVILAYIVGFEGAVKLARGIMPDHFDRGWHPTSTLGTIGAAIAVGKLLKLDSFQMSNTIGNAVSQASGVMGNLGTTTKPFHAGKGASNGVLAASLANKGITANQNIIEDPRGGFCEVFGEKGKYKLDNIIDNLGNPFEIIKSGITIKKYPSCFCTHTSIEGALQVKKNYNFDENEIKNITCRMHPRRLSDVNRPVVSTPHQGKFSVQYCIALSFLYGSVKIKDFDESRFPIDKEIQEIMKKIHVEEDLSTEEYAKEEIDRVKATIIVEMNNGNKYTQKIESLTFFDAETSIENDEFLIEKYTDCCNNILNKETITDSLDLLRNLESENNIRNITRFF